MLLGFLWNLIWDNMGGTEYTIGRREQKSNLDPLTTWGRGQKCKTFPKTESIKFQLKLCS